MSAKPSNSLRKPVSELIRYLQGLPEGTTYQETEEGSLFYGGETPEQDLGTAYRMVIDIVEGFNPPRDLMV